MTLLGPLEALAGEWEGDQGLDVSFHHDVGEVADTPYREKATFKPFGPVENGRQVLYGLDYKSAMWRGDEANPFHTELGYWLWVAERGHVMRAFIIPRGSAILAGGPAAWGSRQTVPSTWCSATTPTASTPTSSRPTRPACPATARTTASWLSPTATW